jgi:monomeric isocitrate dehydrogenase
VFENPKHAAVLREVGANANNGLSDIFKKLGDKFPEVYFCCLLKNDDSQILTQITQKDDRGV